MKRPVRILMLFLPLVVLAAGAFLAVYLVKTAPATDTVDKPRPAKIVQTVELIPHSERIEVTVYGTVVPARLVVARPEVRGRIVRHHAALVPGGFLHAGEELIGIDPSDYELAVAEKETALEEAQFEFAVEAGRQVIAAREWTLLQDDLTEGEVNRSLVLREPHLRRAEAVMQKARNDIEIAKLSLSRTAVVVPFNGMVLDEAVEVGQLVEPGKEVCTLVGTDEFWVQATLSLDQLSSIRLPTADHPGADAKVFLDTGNGGGRVRDGVVVRLLGDLDPTGRMARVVVEVPDPMALAADDEGMPLLLGSYVRVDIDAGERHDLLTVPRSAIREGNRIWVVDADDLLQFRDIEVVWSRRDAVLVKNCLEGEERLIVSGLKSALPGMKVEPNPLAATAEASE